MKPLQIITIQISLQELLAATRPNIYKNKKAYSRKEKHSKKY